MSRKQNMHGGGTNTNLNGLAFEESTSLIESFRKHEQIEVNENNDIIFNGETIGFYTEKHDFYKDFLNTMGVEWKTTLSQQLLPDSVFVNTRNKTIYIIEKKFQKSEGSVDEKLQTGPYKRRMYVKLCSSTGYNVEYCYLLNDWFLKDKYRDVKEYLRESGCRYYFNEIPLYALGV
jgi:hypothetical protein